MNDRIFLEESAATAETAEQIPLERPSGLSWKNTFASLKYRNYKLWFWGQMISLLGTWMQITAQGFLIYELTHSSVFLGYAGFAYGIPTWIFMLYGGVLADRVPRRKLLMITQSIMMVLAIILAILTFSGVIQAWQIIILAFCLGTANAFDAPSRVAFVNELVPRKELTNAIALNATMFNTATAIGPAAAGITYAWFGPAWCFTINALSFIGVITALFMMKINKPQNTIIKRKSPLTDLKEGLRYTASHPIIRILVLLVAVVSLFGISFATLMPAWAVKIFHGDASTNGLLQSFRGIGALASALGIATISRYKFKGRLLTLGSMLFPILMFAFAITRWMPLSLFLLVGIGAGLILVFNIANALVQTSVADNLRGRVMGIYTFVFFGFMPLGALIMGTLAEKFGEPEAVIVGSVVTFTAALVIYMTVPEMRKQ